jgi:hypothetical protein
VAGTRFEYLQEWQDEFLALFPHRYDYIYAKHSQPGQSPNWQTESRHPLSDRILSQGAYLFGVRFGKETKYCLLDIDAGSVYHPGCDRFAISRILAALEPLGLVDCLTCTSSYSGGLHLYLPFTEAQNTWELAAVVAALLENAGFHLNPGQLELFPNPRPYLIESNLSLFNAHRLPLQAGSYLLNEDFQPMGSYQHDFVQRWKFAQHRNSTVTAKILQKLLKQYRRKNFRVSGKAEKFLNDLNAEIELGWTGSGQTNRLLGRITMRSYIFHHVLSGGELLTGTALIQNIVQVAQSLPGYTEWCQHCHEIEQRATEWARCIEASRYFPYGVAQGKYQPKAELDTIAKVPVGLSWNQKQSQAARDRICQAIADLLDNNRLPSAATERFQVLLTYGIGGASLYRHRDLWHPNYVVHRLATDSSIEIDGFSELDQLESSLLESSSDVNSDAVACTENLSRDRIGHQLGSAEGAPNWQPYTSLLPENGSNANTGDSFSDRSLHLSTLPGSNSQQVPLRLRSNCVETNQSVAKATQQTPSGYYQARQQTLIDRMQRYLLSDDPILIAEATAWARLNPQFLPQTLRGEDSRQELEGRRESQPLSLGVNANDDMLPTDGFNPPLQHAQDVGADQLSLDLSDVLAAIAVYIHQLQLTRDQVRDRLQTLFGKSNQSLLDDSELAYWKHCLASELSITPNRT